jgi:NAD(P)-dependent dehydrogenase (short-subunit alcohol dehydrogenase family)
VSGVVVIGACSGFGMELALALRGQGVTVVLADRSPAPDFGATIDAGLLDIAMVREVPQHMRPLPIAAALVERFPVPVKPAPRWLPRPREQRTRK